MSPWVVMLAGGLASAQTRSAPPVAPGAPVTPVAPRPKDPMPDPEVPAPEVIASAKAAVAKLGGEVVLGHYGVAIERMYPTWKKRMAEKVGGMEQLEAKLSGAAKQMQTNGVSLISFKPEGQPIVHEVGLGKKTVTVNGTQSEVGVFTKWMMFIPTTTQFRFFKPNDPKPYVVESTGFQVAISDKGKNDWTFIDGSGLTVSDLRGLFLTLPEDLELPPIGGREVGGAPQR